VALAREGSEPHVLLTRRTDDVETHKGQYAFPGGMTDEGDADPVHTALREADEELGIKARLVHPITLLDDLSTPTGFVITPVVATLEAKPPLTPNPTEVAEAFWAPLSFFGAKEHGRSEQRDVRGVQREVWFYDFEGRIIWGATAWILRRLLWRLGELE
jgi:8-oxo-dGTP pyrophosphatase MutT (NUDIX family)